jgi:hypothetical protein
MKVSQEAISKYGVRVADSGRLDMDSYAMLQAFEAPEGSKVLCVGCHDEATANILQESGFSVTGVDLREYDKNLPSCNYQYLRGDFCDPELPLEKYQAFVSLSAIEHFGYGTYQEGSVHRYYDVIAMRKAWEVLDWGGSAYITVPFGKTFVEGIPHWRVYDQRTIQDRLIQDFSLEGIFFFCSATALVNGVERAIGDMLSLEEASSYDNPDVPHVTVFLILRKSMVQRLAPDGR